MSGRWRRGVERGGYLCGGRGLGGNFCLLLLLLLLFGGVCLWDLALHIWWDMGYAL